MNVLETRPCIAGGVSRCESVCAGTTTKAMANPIVKVLSAAVAVNRKAPSRAAPPPRAKSPARTRTGIERTLAAVRTTWVPTIRPTPTMALIAPYSIAPAPSVSRM